MNPDIQKILRKQSRWQKDRKNLSWPEKIRMAQKVRESIIALKGDYRESQHLRDQS
jgi:hypothetical protein